MNSNADQPSGGLRPPLGPPPPGGGTSAVGGWRRGNGVAEASSETINGVEAFTPPTRIKTPKIYAWEYPPTSEEEHEEDEDYEYEEEENSNSDSNIPYQPLPWVITRPSYAARDESAVAVRGWARQLWKELAQIKVRYDERTGGYNVADQPHSSFMGGRTDQPSGGLRPPLGPPPPGGGTSAKSGWRRGNGVAEVIEDTTGMSPVSTPSPSYLFEFGPPIC
jgi:hypothetical protein